MDIDRSTECGWLYDFPEYYEALFSWDRSAEALFYDTTLQVYGLSAGQRIIELACGPGQVGVMLARMGWQMIGLDLEAGMTQLFQQRADEEGVTVETLVADMTDFTLSAPAAGAICPMGSASLLGEDGFRRHLAALAENISPGGVYLIDNEWTDGPTVPVATSEWEWTVEADGVHIEVSEDFVFVEDQTRPDNLQLAWGPVPNQLNTHDFLAWVSQSPAWRVVGFHPPVATNEEGVDIFDPAERADRPEPGRSIAVLRRV